MVSGRLKVPAGMSNVAAGKSAAISEDISRVRLRSRSHLQDNPENPLRVMLSLN
jgi:hypothetical protein